MKEDSGWAILLMLLAMVVLVVWGRLTWNWKHRQSSGQLPCFGQSWISPRGKRLYVLGNTGRIVSFTDSHPLIDKINQFDWPIDKWREMVERERLILDQKNWGS